MKVYFENGLTVIDTGNMFSCSANTSGHVGVSWHKQKQRYKASIRIKDVDYYLGSYKDIEDAIAIRVEAEKHRKAGTLDEWHQSLKGNYNQKQKGSASK